MIRLEEYVFSMGNWQNVDDLEDNLTLQELHRHFLTQQRKEYENHAFHAALQGVKLNEYNDPDYEDATTFEELKQRVAARQAEANGGKTSSYPELEDMGFAVEEY